MAGQLYANGCLPNSMFESPTNKDKEWFLSENYRNIIMEAFHRQKNPLRIVFLRHLDEYIGFVVYVIYHSEDGKCLIVDF